MRSGHDPRKSTVIVMIAAIFLGTALACSPEGPEGGFPTHPTDRVSITLEWTAPTEDAMGRPLTDLVGYHLYYSPSQPPNGDDAVIVDVGLATQHTVTDLIPGGYYFGVTAVDASGNESSLSEPLWLDLGT